MDLKGKKILVTGGSGFFGSRVVSVLTGKGTDVFVSRSCDNNLVAKDQCYSLFEAIKPDIVIHMAAKCGGIGANRAAPGEFFYENMAMGMNVLNACRDFGVKKTVILGTVCMYPKFAPAPFKEDDIWNGYPEETNAPYGIAKKACMVMGNAYRQQYGMNIITLIPVNLYGEEDHLDLQKNHVIPALVKKFVDAKVQGLPSVEIWGTGAASREFLHVVDAARAVAMATEKYDGSEPVNLGTGQEITIRDLVFKIKDRVGYEGQLIWDTEKPDGQPRRVLDVTRAEEFFGFRAAIGLDEGLERTISWYERICQ